MRSRRVIVGIVVALVASAGVFGTVRWSMQQAPDFYEEAIAKPPAPAVQQVDAQRFVERTLELVQDLRESGQWAEEFSQQQVNSWLAEHVQTKYPDLFKGVHDPRVKFGDGTVDVGFRLDNDAWKGIVSFRVRPRVESPNQLALEVEMVRAGILPVPLETILKRLRKKFDLDGWHVRSKQVDGADVVLVYLDPDGEDGPVLEAVEVIKGALKVAGSREDSQPRERASTDDGGGTRIAKVIRTAGVQSETN